MIPEYSLANNAERKAKIAELKAEARAKGIRVLTDLFVARVPASFTGNELADALRDAGWSVVFAQPLRRQADAFRVRFESCWEAMLALDAFAAGVELGGQRLKIDIWKQL